MMETRFHCIKKGCEQITRWKYVFVLDFYRKNMFL